MGSFYVPACSIQGEKEKMNLNIDSLNQFLGREKNLNEHIPFVGLHDNCLITKNGELVRTYHISGRFFETTDVVDLNHRNAQLNSFLRSITSSQVAVYVHRVRSNDNEEMTADYGNEFCNDFAEKYMRLVANRNLQRTDLYLSIVYRPFVNKAQKAVQKAGRRTIEEIKQDRLNSMEKMAELSNKIENSLRRYYPRLLQSYEKNGIEYNEQLSFMNFLLTFQWQPIRVLKNHRGVPALVYSYLGNARIQAGQQMLEVNTPTSQKFAQVIELKEYNSYTQMGMLDELLYPSDTMPYCFIETQSYAFKSRFDAKKYLTTQKNQLKSSEDGAVAQLEEMDEAINDLMDGKFSVGEYHYSLLVIGDTAADCRYFTQSASAQIQDLGFLPFVSTAANTGAYFAQLPTNFKYRPRIANLTSGNFSMLAPLNNFPSGKKHGNPWGDAVLPLLTPSNQAVYFNFHDSPANTDNYNDKLLANTMVIGKSGSGKTVFLTALTAFMQKYRYDINGEPVDFNCIYFDKDKGAEIAIQAMGGGYLSLESGQPTGFNPFQLENTESNRIFLNKLVCLLLEQTGEKVTVSDQAKVQLGIETVMRMPREMRRLSTVLQNITEGASKEERENSIHKRLAQWVDDGIYAWVFDENDEDLLDFGKYSIFGIDGTSFLDDKTARAPIAMYLLYRMEELVDGRRFYYVMDEFWKWLEDDVFSEFCKDKQLTIRKLNGFGLFATQQPDIILNNPNASALLGQTATLILMPNPTADRKEYMEGYKLNEAEYEIVRTLNEDSRMFLVKQTGVDDKGDMRSYVASLDLSDPEFKNTIRVLSGSAEKVPLCRKAIAEMGQDPINWLPRYFELLDSGHKMAAV